MAVPTLPTSRSAGMSPAAIRAWHERQAAAAANPPAPAAPAPAAPTPFPKPTVHPVTGVPLGATPVNGSQPLVPTPFETPTPQPPQPTNTASMITGVAAPATGGNAPVQTTAAPSTGGNGPVASNPFPTIQQPQQVYQPNMSAGQVVQDYMTELLGENSGYIQNARRNGIELAANRGLLNSSIAAGNSQRAAIDAAQPILNQITNLHNQREQLAFTGEQNQMDRDQQITMARVADWAANNQFNREYNGNLSLLPIKNIMDLNAQLTQAAIDNPEIFPPEVVSGLGEFFGTNMLAMLRQWFPSQYGGT